MGQRLPYLRVRPDVEETLRHVEWSVFLSSRRCSCSRAVWRLAGVKPRGSCACWTRAEDPLATSLVLLWVAALSQPWLIISRSPSP